MLIGQIVSGFEEKAVINQTTVNDAGVKQTFHLPSLRGGKQQLALAALKKQLTDGSP